MGMLSVHHRHLDPDRARSRRRRDADNRPKRARWTRCGERFHDTDRRGVVRHTAVEAGRHATVGDATCTVQRWTLLLMLTAKTS